MSTCPSAASAITKCSRTSSRASTARAMLAAIRRARPPADSTSAGGARSRGPGDSILGVVLLPPQQLADCVEDGGRHLGLARPWDRDLLAAGDDCDLVGGRV